MGQFFLLIKISKPFTMKKLSYLFVFSLSTVLIISSCSEPWQPVFNGENLDNWDTYLGTPVKGQDSLAEVVTEDRVFSIVQEDGVNLIRISGEINGSLATRDTFSNYHLQLIYKWGDEVFATRNSGLLYHSFGEFGEAHGTWMVNIECQLMHERLGDTYLMNNTYCTASATQDGDVFQYAPGGENMKFSEEHNSKVIKKALDAENPIGEWNKVDLYCVGRSAVHVVNGQKVMEIHNTGTLENGEVVPLTSGKIQIQSEGGEMFIKTVQIKPIDEIPEEFPQE